MKKYYLVLTALLFCLTAQAQVKEINLDKMPEKKRNEYLISESKKIVMRYGPGYYRDIKPPIIKRLCVDDADAPGFAEAFEKANKGRPFYSIEYPYDETVESFNLSFAAKVYFWADTGKAFDVSLGAGWGYDLEEPQTGTTADKRFLPYERKSPHKKREWEK